MQNKLRWFSCWLLTKKRRSSMRTIFISLLHVILVCSYVILVCFCVDFIFSCDSRFNRTKFHDESLLSLCKHTLVFWSIKIVNDQYAMCTHDKNGKKILFNRPSILNAIRQCWMRYGNIIGGAMQCTFDTISWWHGIDHTYVDFSHIHFKFTFVECVCACALWRSLII